MMKKKLFLFFVLIIIMFEFISAGEGGASVPVINIDLSEQGNDYSMKPGRLTFEFNEKLYAIQVRKINKESVDFLIMTLNMNKLEDITAYTLDYSFSLKRGENKEIDLNKDNINDISIELNNLIPNTNSIKSADFLIKKINNNIEEDSTKITTTSMTGNAIQEPIFESVHSKESFFGNIVNWFMELFK